jgi:hypothetical protein
MVNYDRIALGVLIGILFSGAIVAVAEVDTCSSCNDYFVQKIGDNMTGSLWLPNMRVFNANSEENSTHVGDGTDFWKVGVWDLGVGIGNSINLRATQKATISFGNMTDPSPALVFAPSNITSFQQPQYIFTAFNESGISDGALLILVGDKQNLAFTWWMIGAKRFAHLVDNDGQYDFSFGFLTGVKVRYTPDDLEIVAECSPAGLFCGSNPTRELSLMPQGDLLLKPNSTNTFSTGHIIPSTNVTYDLGSAGLAWRSLYVQTVYEGSAGAIESGVDEFMDLDLDNKDEEELKLSFPEEIKDTYTIKEYNQKVAVFNGTYEFDVPWSYVPKPLETIRIERRREIVPNGYLSKASAGEDEVITQETFLDVFGELRFTQKILQQVMTETCIRDRTYSWCS